MFKERLLQEVVNKSHIHKIDIFDFDNTLVFTPTLDELKDMLARYNFHAVNSGKDPINFNFNEKYWYDPRSMEPPIIPSPTPCAMLNQPIAKLFYASQRNPQILTIVMTGRPPSLKTQLERILDDFKMKPDRIYMMPDNKNGTINNKLKHLAELVDEFPRVLDIEMWDDRGPIVAKEKDDPSENHVGEFKKFLSLCHVKRQRRNQDWVLKFKVNEIPPRK